jgi:hypothetical protein
MVPEEPADDFHHLWKSQPAGEGRMSIDDIRNRARAMEGTIRRRNLREYIAGVIVLVAFGFVAWTDSSSVVRIGAALIIVALLYVVHQMRTRGRVQPMPASLGLMDCIAFHRNELERQRDLLQSIWSWYLLPFVPGMLVILIGRAIQRPERRAFVAVSAVGVAAAFFVVGWINARVAKRIQRRIDELG